MKSKKWMQCHTILSILPIVNLWTFQEHVEENCSRNAMYEEIKPLKKNDTWELTSLSKGHKVSVKGKENANGEVVRYKLRLVWNF